MLKKTAVLLFVCLLCSGITAAERQKIIRVYVSDDGESLLYDTATEKKIVIVHVPEYAFSIDEKTQDNEWIFGYMTHMRKDPGRVQCFEVLYNCRLKMDARDCPYTGGVQFCGIIEDKTGRFAKSCDGTRYPLEKIFESMQSMKKKIMP